MLFLVTRAHAGADGGLEQTQFYAGYLTSDSFLSVAPVFFGTPFEKCWSARWETEDSRPGDRTSSGIRTRPAEWCCPAGRPRGAAHGALDDRRYPEPVSALGDHSEPSYLGFVGRQGISLPLNSHVLSRGPGVQEYVHCLGFSSNA